MEKKKKFAVLDGTALKLIALASMVLDHVGDNFFPGHHTTTRRQLIRLSSGVLIIDTPGMRELGMVETSEGLETTFADVEALLKKCRFSDCRHEREPGCAIRAAIASGELDAARWESYKKLQAQAQDWEDMLRRKREWSKGVAKSNKLLKKARKTDGT